MAHWKEKLYYKNDKYKIVKFANISTIYNDVDYYVLVDSENNFIDKSIYVNQLMDSIFTNNEKKMNRTKGELL